MNGWTTAAMTPQDGRRFVVTGATGGLGFETALALAQAGGDVLLTGRNPAKGAAAVARIRERCADASVRYADCDQASLAAVDAFASEVRAEGRPIDALVNNAGVMAVPQRMLTRDGFEMQLGVNVIGHVRLTARLLPLIRAAAGRVVSVASLAHLQGRIAFDDLDAARTYRPWARYQQSKLAMLLFALELHRHAEAGGWGIVSTAAHPGLAATDLFRRGDTTGPRSRIQRALSPVLCQSAAAGAWPILMATTARGIEPGGYYGPGHPFETRGPARPARIGASARDKTVAARLWQEITRLSGATWPEDAA